MLEENLAQLVPENAVDVNETFVWGQSKCLILIISNLYVII